MYSMEATFSLSVLQTAATQHFTFLSVAANTSAMFRSLPPCLVEMFLDAQPHSKLFQAQTGCANILIKKKGNT